jgi:hypothetical protein
MLAILLAFWRAVVVAEQPFCLLTGDTRPLVVLLIVRIPSVAVFDRELPVPLPVGRLVYLVDMDVTALTQRDHVGDAIVGVISVEMMERKLVLPPLAAGGVEPAIG